MIVHFWSCDYTVRISSFTFQLSKRVEEVAACMCVEVKHIRTSATCGFLVTFRRTNVTASLQQISRHFSSPNSIVVARQAHLASWLAVSGELGLLCCSRRDATRRDATSSTITAQLASLFGRTDGPASASSARSRRRRNKWPALAALVAPSLPSSLHEIMMPATEPTDRPRVEDSRDVTGERESERTSCLKERG